MFKAWTSTSSAPIPFASSKAVSKTHSLDADSSIPTSSLFNIQNFSFLPFALFIKQDFEELV
jgi:hypothetical protein